MLQFGSDMCNVKVSRGIIALGEKVRDVSCCQGSSQEAFLQKDVHRSGCQPLFCHGCVHSFPLRSAVNCLGLTSVCACGGIAEKGAAGVPPWHHYGLTLTPDDVVCVCAHAYAFCTVGRNLPRSIVLCDICSIKVWAYSAHPKMFTWARWPLSHALLTRGIRAGICCCVCLITVKSKCSNVPTSSLQRQRNELREDFKGNAKVFI